MVVIAPGGPLGLGWQRWANHARMTALSWFSPMAITCAFYLEGCIVSRSPNDCFFFPHAADATCEIHKSARLLSIANNCSRLLAIVNNC